MNGTGKTNFADLIVFLSFIRQRGLNGALEEFGGQRTTRQPGKGTPFRLHVDLSLDEDLGAALAKYSIDLHWRSPTT